MASDDGDMTLAGRLLAWQSAATPGPCPGAGEPRDPYRVLVSELMLQQTQVDRVTDRFETFVAAYPDLATLAGATEDEVLAAWSGLGYYRRARLLHRLARGVRAGSGALPTSAAELGELPGVGPYTAAAVASLAFGEAIPVLDGNVLRVASRVLAAAGDPRTAAGREALLCWLRPLVEVGGPPGLVNEALMELGAIVCRPTSPNCAALPARPRLPGPRRGVAGALPTAAAAPRRAGRDVGGRVLRGRGGPMACPPGDRRADTARPLAAADRGAGAGSEPGGGRPPPGAGKAACAAATARGGAPLDHPPPHHGPTNPAGAVDQARSVRGGTLGRPRIGPGSDLVALL